MLPAFPAVAIVTKVGCKSIAQTSIAIGTLTLNFFAANTPIYIGKK